MKHLHYQASASGRLDVFEHELLHLFWILQNWCLAQERRHRGEPLVLLIVGMPHLQELHLRARHAVVSNQLGHEGMEIGILRLPWRVVWIDDDGLWWAELWVSLQVGLLDLMDRKA